MLSFQETGNISFSAPPPPPQDQPTWIMCTSITQSCTDHTVHTLILSVNMLAGSRLSLTKAPHLAWSIMVWLVKTMSLSLTGRWITSWILFLKSRGFVRAISNACNKHKSPGGSYMPVGDPVKSPSECWHKPLCKNVQFLNNKRKDLKLDQNELKDYIKLVHK